MSGFDAVGFGALNMDQIFRVGRILTDGETLIEEQKRLPGGSAANTIYGLAKLGLKTGFLGAVGDDEDGRTIIEDLRKVGVDTSQIKVKSRVRTGTVLSLINRSGARALYVAPGANSLLGWEDLNTDYAGQARLVHLSPFADELQLELQKALVAQLPVTVKVSFAPGALYAERGLEALRPIIRRVHVIFINREEIRLLTGRGIEEGAKELRKLGCRIVAVTLGEEGSYVASEEGALRVEPVKAKVIDTTGAGDAFAVGFLYGFLKGKDLRECAHLGHIVASFCVSEIGARTGLPSLEGLLAAK